MYNVGDRKGVVVKDSGNNVNFTYYGGRTEKSEAYKKRFLPGYESSSRSCNTQLMDPGKTKRGEDYNLYENKTWYQAQLHSAGNVLAVGATGDFRDKGSSWQKITQRESSLYRYDIMDNSGKVVSTVHGGKDRPFADTFKSNLDECGDRTIGLVDFDERKDRPGAHTESPPTSALPERRAFGNSKPIRRKA